MDMLEISGLKKSFGDKKVLNGLELWVPENSVFGFIGKNGAGKTTTMKMILGLLKADEGEIFVNGERVIYGESSANRFIGYLPDVPEFYSFMNAKEYLAFCAEISGMKKTKAESRSKKLLELVGLEGEKHRIKGFSRGMKQRLGIAQALLAGPKLLICDEPTSSLDPIGRKEILEVILSAREETTVLFSTHILSDVEKICTDLALLDKGRICLQGKLSQIKEKYSSEKYLVRTEKKEDALLLKEAFPKMDQEKDGALSFFQKDVSQFELLSFAAQKRIALLSFEKAEASLESLFLEVTGK